MSFDGAGQSEHRADVDSPRVSLFSRRCGAPAALHVTARFLPYDDVRRLTRPRRAGRAKAKEREEEREEEEEEEEEEEGKPPAGSGARGPSAPRLASPPFPGKLRAALRTLEALGEGEGEGEGEEGEGGEEEGEGAEGARARWAELFERWPLELAASGYAEWWLRHRWCPADAAKLLQKLIDALPNVERYRRQHRSDGRDTSATAPMAEEAAALSRDLRGAVRMLLAVYADPPRSLRVAFLTPPFRHHHQLFFYACRLGAHRQQGVTEQEDAVELGLFLSLAAASAEKIDGSHLEMRGDLMRFLGRVEQNWENLLKNRSEEELSKNRKPVQSLLTVASDRVT